MEGVDFCGSMVWIIFAGAGASIMRDLLGGAFYILSLSCRNKSRSLITAVLI